MAAFEAWVHLSASLGPSTLLQMSPCFKLLQLFRHVLFFLAPQQTTLPRDMYSCIVLLWISRLYSIHLHLLKVANFNHNNGCFIYSSRYFCQSRKSAETGFMPEIHPQSRAEQVSPNFPLRNTNPGKPLVCGLLLSPAMSPQQVPLMPDGYSVWGGATNSLKVYEYTLFSCLNFGFFSAGMSQVSQPLYDTDSILTRETLLCSSVQGEVDRSSHKSCSCASSSLWEKTPNFSLNGC